MKEISVLEPVKMGPGQLFGLVEVDSILKNFWKLEEWLNVRF